MAEYAEHTEQVGPTPPQQKPARPPKRELQGMNWLVANMANQTVEFSAGEVEMKHGLFIDNCRDCLIRISDKFKSLQMNNCANVTLVVNSCVSGVEVMNGEGLEIRVTGHSPSVSIDKCQRVRVVLNEDFMNTDIVTAKISEVNVTYEKNGNEAKAAMIPEQLITKWNPAKRKFDTVVYDKFM
jgi:adenylyl cyclase-associated protein